MNVGCLQRFDFQACELVQLIYVKFRNRISLKNLMFSNYNLFRCFFFRHIFKIKFTYKVLFMYLFDSEKYRNKSNNAENN